MGSQQPAMVEPVDPFERGVFDGFKAAPRSTPVDHLGLVEAVDRLGQSPFDKLRTGLSQLSPALPTDGSIPASARRSVYLMDTYCAPRSL